MPIEENEAKHVEGVLHRVHLRLSSIEPAELATQSDLLALPAVTRRVTPERRPSQVAQDLLIAAVDSIRDPRLRLQADAYLGVSEHFWGMKHLERAKHLRDNDFISAWAQEADLPKVLAYLVEWFLLRNHDDASSPEEKLTVPFLVTVAADFEPVSSDFKVTFVGDPTDWYVQLVGTVNGREEPLTPITFDCNRANRIALEHHASTVYGRSATELIQSICLETVRCVSPSFETPEAILVFVEDVLNNRAAPQYNDSIAAFYTYYKYDKSLSFPLNMSVDRVRLIEKQVGRPIHYVRENSSLDLLDLGYEDYKRRGMPAVMCEWLRLPASRRAREDRKRFFDAGSWRVIYDDYPRDFGSGV